MYCQNGHEMAPGTKFCMKCGAPAATEIWEPDNKVVVGEPGQIQEVEEPILQEATPHSTTEQYPAQLISRDQVLNGTSEKHRAISKPLVIGLSAIALAGAGFVIWRQVGNSGGAGSNIGLNAMMRSTDSQAQANCESFFGSGTDIAQHLGLDSPLYPEANATTGGWCVYATQFGDTIALQVAAERPNDVSQFAGGPVGYVGLYSSGVSYNQTTASQWLQERANALTDDYSEWVSALPPIDAGWASVDALYPDGNTEAYTTLNTPYLKVNVAPAGTPEFLPLDNTYFRADDGYQVVTADVQIIGDSVTNEIPPTQPRLSLIVDGNRADATELLQPLAISGAPRRLAISVPAEASNVLHWQLQPEMQRSLFHC